MLGLESTFPAAWDDTFKSGGTPSGDPADFPSKDELGRGRHDRTLRLEGGRRKRGRPQGVGRCIPGVVLGWKVLGYARRFQAEIVNYADDRAPRRRRREAMMAA